MKISKPVDISELLLRLEWYVQDYLSFLGKLLYETFQALHMLPHLVALPQEEADRDEACVEPELLYQQIFVIIRREVASLCSETVLMI